MDLRFIAPALLALLVACESSPTPGPAAVAFLAGSDSPKCAVFPPNVSGDPNAVACTGHEGEQTAYCHLHTGGKNQAGCEDMPGGPSPQLHCQVPGGGETYTPVYGGGLDCPPPDDDDEPTAAVDLNAPVPSAPPGGPGEPSAVVADDVAVAATDAPAAAAPPTCDPRYDGIPVTISYPAAGAQCQCCVIPSTNSPADTDCSDPDSHCLEVRLGCGLPALSDAARTTLCDALAAANDGDAGYKCMNKTCDYVDDQRCQDEHGAYVSCEAWVCCGHLDWRTEMTLGQCHEEGGLPTSGEDCFGPGQAPVVRPPRVVH